MRSRSGTLADLALALGMPAVHSSLQHGGMRSPHRGFRRDSKLRVGGRLVNKGDMKLLEEFVKAGYV